MKIRCLYDQLIPIQTLKTLFHPKNRNSHPQEQIERLAKILKYQGVRYCAKISKQSGFITSGHGRILAAEFLGWTEFPVNMQDYDDDTQEYADVQADNAIANWSELDLSGINTDIGDLGPDFDIDLLGIENFKVEVAEKLEPQCDEDEVPEPKESIAKLGDVWILGRHRLMCGDSTSIDAVEKLMSGEKADMVFTDPPYGMNLDTDFSKIKGSPKSPNSSGNKYRPVIGDDQDFDPGIIFGVFDYCHEMFLWGADYYCQYLSKGGSWIVWDKKNEALDESIGSGFELCWSRKPHKRQIARIIWTGWQAKERNENRVHPTQKPVALIEWFLERWGKPQNKLVDLFGGSGSTLIACEKTERKCFMMELDPFYCTVIIKRWCKYTGKEAYLLNDDGTQTTWSEIKEELTHGQT